MRADASNFAFSALVSFTDALSGLRQEFYSWTTVKLYYSVFYSLRAILALNDYAIYYEGSKPRGIEASPGAIVEKLAEGNTHKTVLVTFARRHARHPLLSQKIGLEEPLDWLMRRREEANYTGVFSEPLAPPHFERIHASGIRKSIEAYLDDSLYTFDPDHAMIAFPLATIQAMAADGARILEAGVDFVAKRLSDRHGAYGRVVKLVQALSQ